jgi:hypothetical protein
MKQKILLTLIALTAPALGGCAVQAALMLAELAPQIEGPMGTKNAHLLPAAEQACIERARPYGSVFVSEVEQRRADRIIVWGSVTDPYKRRRIFECHFTTKIARFKLGEVLPPD